MHECIPYENLVPFAIQRAVFVTEGSGTHKCVPYENDWALSYSSYLFLIYPISGRLAVRCHRARIVPSFTVTAASFPVKWLLTPRGKKLVRVMSSAS